MATRHSGSCLCGAVCFAVEGRFERFYLCHCARCRKDTGSAHAANLFSSTATIEWASGKDLVRDYTLPGTQHAHAFCSVCGSALPYVAGTTIVVPAGSLDSDPGLDPGAHIFAAARAAWDHQPDRLPVFDALPAATPVCRPKVALVTCAAQAGLTADDRLLLPEFERLGVDAAPAVWSDAGVDWDAFDGVLIRSPWDYFKRDAEFRAWLDARAAGAAMLCNAADILTWNYDKHYLQALADAGLPVVPTAWIEPGERPDIEALAHARGWREVIVKPAVSGGAWRTWRFRVEDAARHARDIETILADRAVLVQPFVPEVVRDGELSLLFFDGNYSHAMCKRAKSGDYRVQAEHGGSEAPFEAEPALVAQARAFVLATPSLPVYARVDGIIRDGRFVLMELEVFEPLMFLGGHPHAARRFARAVHARLLAHADRPCRPAEPA